MEDTILGAISIWLRTTPVVASFDDWIGKCEADWKDRGLQRGGEWAKVNCDPMERWQNEETDSDTDASFDLWCLVS